MPITSVQSVHCIGQNRKHKMYLQKKCKLHKFETTNNNLERDYFRHASSYIVHVYQFSTKNPGLIAQICNYHR